MREIVSDSQALKKHVKESKLPFKKAILDYYRSLGESQGLQVVQDTPIVANQVDYGTIELAWSEPRITFNTEFASIQELMPKIFRNLLAEPELMVLILDSNSKCSPEKARELLSKTPFLKELWEKTEIVDLHPKTKKQ